METPMVKSRGRPRKRRREDSLNEESQEVVLEVFGSNGNEQDVRDTGNSRKRGRVPKKRAVETRGEAMVGRYVLKEFDGSGVFLGNIVSYDSGLYRVEYEDGDCEDLDSGELREFLIGNEREQFVGELLERKNNLDEALDKKSGIKLKDEAEVSVKLKDEAEVGVTLKDEPEVGLNLKDESAMVVDEEIACAVENVGLKKSEAIIDGGDVGNVSNDLQVIEVPTLTEGPNEDVSGCDIDDNDDGDKQNDYCFEDDDEDLSSDCVEYGQDWETRADIEIPAFLPPELPPSSGTIGVPEEYVSHLFSVHGALRTFSVHLFLSPFTLDDLVGCLNCTTPNTLLDAIHVALLRALRRHLERLASEGSQLASKCLRSIDWVLLDILTWPIYLVHYLMAMGHLDGPEWKGFYIDVLVKEYCTLSIGIKLMVLQVLCDDALDTEEIRSEIDTRVESEVGVDSDGTSAIPSDRGLSDNPNAVINSDHHYRDTDNVGEDDNGDECRLCGMEGMLVCCDGCPSAYHTRCIGVNKLSIPDGKWFCPECTISKIGPPIINGTSLRGAEVFGMDSYGHLFLGTCNHLLVLKVSLKASSFVRYYHHNDVPKVLSALSTSYHSVSYLGICQAISKYWELPQAVVLPLLVYQESMILGNRDNGCLEPLQSHPTEENETYASCAGECSIHDASESGNGTRLPRSDPNGILLGAPKQNDPRSIPYSRVACVRPNETSTTNNLSEFSRATDEGWDDQLSIGGYGNGVCLPETNCVQVREDRIRAVSRTSQKKADTCLYLGSVFKPFAYINNYVHGAFAACAATNFAGLSADEIHASEIHASDPRKAMAANILLQVKAFSSATVRFFWPSTEKKLFEIPRERCSWCFHCKAPTTSRKGCLLNQAAVTATRAEMKFISGLRLDKIGEGGLYAIAAYTLYMEESIRGLVLGPFQSQSYREQWRMELENVSSCSEMKSLLFDLERNLCTNAVSSEWTKLVDNWMDESSVPQSAATCGSVQKRVSGKRKKHLTTPEVADDDPSDSNEINWWRGGKLATLLFQRGTFPRRFLGKAARQGGSRRLPGVYYADDSDVPKRSRQFIWRAAVEMAKNASQLALQVRYLDQHIKWSDLVRPEQNPIDGKGPETEAFAFRNAQICDKKIKENKIMYGVVFGHQKHLSSRLMKSVVEKEESKDGKPKYWLLEARVPLYLIKEFAEKVERPDLPPPVKTGRYSKHQKRQLKASRKDIFIYLVRKRDGIHVCPCASCHKDVCLEVAVTCSSCEGYCHNNCMLSSMEVTNEGIESRATCKGCSHRKLFSQSNNNVESPTSPLVMQGKEFQNSASVVKSGKLKSSGQHQNSKSKRSKSSKSKKQSSLHLGLMWKKKKDPDDGYQFRLRNIILRGSSDGLKLSPECLLCHKPYSPHLMYIRCDSCENWYHADAVELDESRLSDLVGYKCCRCRRMKSPFCPYDSKPNTTEVKKIRIKGPKEHTVEAVSEATSERVESLASTPMSLMESMEDDVFIDFDYPLPLGEPKSEVVFELNNFEPGPQKLQVRRHIKSENDDDGITWTDFSAPQLPTSSEANNFPDTNVDWDISTVCLEDGSTLNYDSLNFESDYEPQTYFSFTELLEADGSNNPLDGVDASREAWDDFPCDFSQNGFMEQCNTLSSYDELNNPKTSTNPSVGFCCQLCHISSPAPDLACKMCGIQIHHHCSPWQVIFQGDSWICGHCQGQS